MKMILIIFTLVVYLNCNDVKQTDLIVNKIENEVIESEIFESDSIHNQDLNKKYKLDEIDREALIIYAKTFLGTPYKYATQDPNVGFDCSGYINYIFKNYDIIVPRSSSGFKNFGKKVSIEEVAIGDVLVFTGYRDSTSIGHLGIVCEANGLHSKFIHASSGKVMQVTISDLISEHYTNRFLHAVDVIKK